MKSKDNISQDFFSAPQAGIDAALHSEGRLFPEQPESSEISVACYRADYSASVIARAVEDADAHLLNLNVTSEVLPSGEIVIDLRVSHRNAGAVSRSLERYGYTTLRVNSGTDEMNRMAAERVAELMAHISV